MQMFGFAINNWVTVKFGRSNSTKTVEKSDIHQQEGSPELHGLPPSYESIHWKDEMKIPCIPSATHYSTLNSKKSFPIPARPFPKDWKTSVGPQNGFLRSSGYSSLINENNERRS
ncbi:hypothetical protein MJO29_011041 [Puccinia striiformis f. sp. tritici]|uniref:Uncharacterized protein n=2 Tax=Puccinia striiformis TaxID=27350 RepID=A0A0L0VGK7_9BASI|nr:hypothetical protein Pst134EA_020953 [Puccinia striiformis f. sp. tritici]KAI9612548.1 hypothetical protein H4Q26_007705 [Puccinia striiformis f. sp. tritici PST-130]KNE98425.1 hypothetical protein PSTG_08339 [Puccinia striiformis f. sp. tritici PST-78]POW12664.1 hypothetical protein PSHT_08013 [Puccinia striiformis]KAH9447725.1 hypothetical protein Pst134EB_021727 [Puccinia striiformis f. sp. tritici]KAH9457054.1 hypothetical protein Pst134EA_020953 [Puccinia striiformis f. sp. tritici]